MESTRCFSQGHAMSSQNVNKVPDGSHSDRSDQGSVLETDHWSNITSEDSWQTNQEEISKEELVTWGGNKDLAQLTQNDAMLTDCITC